MNTETKKKKEKKAKKVKEGPQPQAVDYCQNACLVNPKPQHNTKGT